VGFRLLADGPAVIGQIFVIGTARSGTTWLGNLLGSHPFVAAVLAPEHHGIHESHLFDHTRYILQGRMSCAEFVRQYAAEDYFRLTGITHAELCDGAPADDAVGFFTRLMELYARSQSARWWLEKTPKHAIYVDEIVRRFPDARFVVIRRSMEDTLLSQLARFPKPGAGRVVQVAEKAFRYASDMRAIKRLERLAVPRVLAVTYEDLVRDLEGESRRLQAFLGLPYHPLESRFEPASSFGSEGRPKPPLRRLDRAIVAACSVTLRFVPFGLLVRLRQARDKSQAVEIPKFALVAPRGDLPA
jgi:hypothetical protein